MLNISVFSKSLSLIFKVLNIFGIHFIYLMNINLILLVLLYFIEL